MGVDRPAAKGDYANIDLTAEIDGEVVDSQEGVSYELGSETMLDGLDEALEGLSSGEETTFEGTLEAGEHEGEKAQVKVKVNSVKAEELPELDDDFASEASEFDTLDELKEDLKKAASQDAEGVRPPQPATLSSPSSKKVWRFRCRRALRLKWLSSSSRV